MHITKHMANNSIYNELQSKHMIEAFAMLTTKVNSLNDWQLQEELEQAESTYNNMLSFIAKGVKDPDRHRILYGVIRAAYSINDRANIEIRLKKHPADRYCKKIAEFMSEPLDNAGIQKALDNIGEETDNVKHSTDKSFNESSLSTDFFPQDKLIGQIFDRIWTSQLWDQSDYSMYLSIISDDKIPSLVRSIIISAVTLAAFEIFDQNKIMLLFDAYLDKDTQISQRALVGLLLLIVRYDSRILFYPQIETRFDLYAENQQFVHDCFRILKQLQYSNFTDIVAMKMATDIIPAIMNSPKYTPIKHIRLDKQTDENEENPEWTANTEKDNKAEKKIQQISELQQDGADVYWSTFRNLKRLPFFNSMHHWFVPFANNMQAVQNILKNLRPQTISIIQRLFSIPTFCDSDKYSFLNMVEAMDSNTQDFTVDQIQSQLGDIDPEASQDIGKNKITAENTSRFYIQDLYRFFKIYPLQSQFFDPFRKGLPPFVPNKYHLLSRLIPGNYDEVLAMADFMMKWEHYTNAIEMYNLLDPKAREEDAYIWQRIAFCYQKIGNLDMAVKEYETAYKLQPNSDWTLKHLAQTEFDSHKFKEAAGHIDMILERDDKNLKWLLLRAKCYMKQGDYEGSIPVLYKAVYIDETSNDAQKLLIYSLIETGNSQKGEKVAKEMVEHNPTTESLITLGHMLLYNQKEKEAFDTYLKCYQRMHNKETFKKIFWNEADNFIHDTQDDTCFQLMFDAITTWKAKTDD